MFLGALASGVGAQLSSSDAASAAGTEQYGVESKSVSVFYPFICDKMVWTANCTSACASTAAHTGKVDGQLLQFMPS